MCATFDPSGQACRCPHFISNAENETLNPAQANGSNFFNFCKSWENSIKIKRSIVQIFKNLIWKFFIYEKLRKFELHFDLLRVRKIKTSYRIKIPVTFIFVTIFVTLLFLFYLFLVWIFVYVLVQNTKISYGI